MLISKIGEFLLLNVLLTDRKKNTDYHCKTNRYITVLGTFSSLNLKISKSNNKITNNNKNNKISQNKLKH